MTTDNAFDLMINGHGFFEILMPDGTISYTRNGQFTTDSQGNIVTSGEGYQVQPTMTVPPEATGLTVSQDGEVSVRIPGQAENAVIGNLVVTNFINPSGLEPIGQNLFKQTGASGDPVQGVPGLEGRGFIVQGALESSNVNVTEELVGLIESQRVYEMNSKVISSVDQMLSFAIQQL